MAHPGATQGLQGQVLPFQKALMAVKYAPPSCCLSATALGRPSDC